MTTLKFHDKPLTLFNLAKVVLGYSKITEKHRVVWCDPLERNVKKFNRHLYLKPRGTYKSTIYTVSFVINYLIQDWYKHNGKFTTPILVTSATNELAQQFVGEIKQHLVENEKLHEIFGYNPVKRENQQEIWLYPRVVKKEPSIKAKGALSGITSEHYGLIICDDLCFDDKTEILTNEGWKYFKDLNKNETVLTLGKNGEAVYQSPMRYIEKEHNGEMIGIEHQTCEFLTTPEHNVLFKHYRYPKYNLERADCIFGKYGYLKKDVIWNGNEIKTVTIPEVIHDNNLKESEKVIDADLFFEFLGIYIAEGDLNSRHGNKYNAVRLSQSLKHKDVCDYIESILDRMPFKYGIYVNKENSNQYTISSTQLAEYLKQFGVGSLNLSIPQFVVESSTRQIKLFLHGHWMGDGGTSDGGGKFYHTSSKKLADGLHELVLKSGNISNVSEREYNTITPAGTYYNGISYSVHEFKENSKKSVPYIRPKNWYKQNYNGTVYCVEVPNHIIYVRRNGKGCWMGNCNSEDRESETIREKKKRWLQDLISILDPDGLLIVIGTRWHGDDLYQQIIDNNEKLPESMRYHIEVEAVIDKDEKLLFPTIIDYIRIAALKIEKGLVEFYSQYMNNPLPSETQLFSVERMLFYDEAQESLDKEYNFCYMDPALGSLAEGKNDYIVVLFGARKNKRVYIRDAIITNTTTPDAVIKDMKILYEKYKCSYAGVESNGYQTLFAKSVREQDMIVKEVRSSKPKRVRIESIEPTVASGKIAFRDDWRIHYPLLIEQMVIYPVGKHDDVPDAVHGLALTGSNKLSGVKKESLRGLVSSKSSLLRGKIRCRK